MSTLRERTIATITATQAKDRTAIGELLGDLSHQQKNELIVSLASCAAASMALAARTLQRNVSFVQEVLPDFEVDEETRRYMENPLQYIALALARHEG